MHLTNYSVNRENTDFQKDGDPSDIHCGISRSLVYLYKFLEVTFWRKEMGQGKKGREIERGKDGR